MTVVPEPTESLLLPGVQVLSKTLKGPRLRTRTKTGKKIADHIKEAKASLKWPANYIICKDTLDLGRLAREIATHGKFAYDTETSGLNPWADSLSCISLYVGGNAYLVNFRHPLLPQLSYREFADVVGPYLSDVSVQRIGFNLPFDNHFLEEQASIPVGEQHFDGYVATWLLYPDAREKGLKSLGERFLGDTGSSFVEQFGHTDWTVIDPQVAAYYALHDAELHWKWYEHCERHLKAVPDLHKLMYELEMPVANIYYETERDGLELDMEYLQAELAVHMAVALEASEAEIRSIAKDCGVEFTGNLAKPEDVADLLFNKLKLPRIKGDSTARAVLEVLKDRHKIIPPFLDYRATYKLKTAFVDALPELVTRHVGADGRVSWRLHPTVNTIGSETGRSSMRDPNLLQMPARIGAKLRRAILAGEGYYLVSKDLSGQELRIQAALSGDTVLREVVLTGGDIYSETAAVFYGGKASDYTKSGPNKAKRDKGKMAVLALSYGASEFKMAQIFDCSVDRAKRFMADFWKRFPGLKALTDKSIAFAKKNGYVQSIFGRRRPVNYSPRFGEEGAASPGYLASLDRICANTPIQASAADQIKLAVLLCHQHLKKNGYKTRILFAIHDEILFKADAQEWETTPLASELAYIMEHAVEFPGIPMKTSTEIYPERWAETACDDDPMNKCKGWECDSSGCLCGCHDQFKQEFSSTLNRWRHPDMKVA